MNAQYGNSAVIQDATNPGQQLQVNADGSINAKMTGAPSFATRVVVAAGAVTVATTDYYVVVNKTVGAATIVNLPASPATGLTFVIKDGKGDAGTNNITITPAAGNIDGQATYAMNVNWGSATVFYNGSQWNLG